MQAAASPADSFTLRNVHKTPVSAVAFGQSSKLASACSSLVVIWDTNQWRQLFNMQRQAAPTCMVWDPSTGADRIATVSRSDKTLRLWDLRTKREEVVPVDKIDMCTSVAWSPQGASLVLRGDRSLGLMDVRKLRTYTAQRKFDYKVTDCQYSSPEQLTVATELGEIEFLDSTSLETRNNKLVAHVQQALLVRNTAQMMCTAGNDSMVQVWDRGDLSCSFTVDTLMSRVRTMQIGGGDRYLVASADKTFEAVDLLTGRALFSPAVGTVKDEITSMACDQQLHNKNLLLAYCCANEMDVFVQQVATPT